MQAAPPPDALEIGTYTTFSDGRKGVKEETDHGQNPQKLWKTVPGSSERRGRAKWTCSAHVGCKVELVLKSDESAERRALGSLALAAADESGQCQDGAGSGGSITVKKEALDDDQEQEQ